ncbi:UNVERIFIED_CONTAM: hypothetical protein Slati_2960400 [Sesamum latifolium]|uniref:Uncharacterized protein n=1 Tax=Sesamum latifolium TaxID=2727402 RepID=A0AAW2VJE8_9LAMI
MDWAQRMIFDATRPSYFSSSHDGVPDDGTRSCPLDADRSEYCYGSGPYNYKSGLADHFDSVVHAADQPLWNGCTQPYIQSQLGVVAELVDIKVKPTREQDLRRKKSPYAVLMYLPLTPHLQRLYSSRAIAERMTWHATHQTEEGWMCHPSDTEAWKHFDQMYPDFAEEPRNVRLGLCSDGFAPHMLMWTVNDLPAYGMASGWSTTGVMGCPICMDDTSVFHLQHGRKACYFDCQNNFSLSNIPTKGTRKPSQKIVSRIRLHVQG